MAFLIYRRKVTLPELSTWTANQSRLSGLPHKRGFQVFEHAAERDFVQTKRYSGKSRYRVSTFAHNHTLIVKDMTWTVQV